MVPDDAPGNGDGRRTSRSRLFGQDLEFSVLSLGALGYGKGRDIPDGAEVYGTWTKARDQTSRFFNSQGKPLALAIADAQAAAGVERRNPRCTTKNTTTETNTDIDNTVVAIAFSSGVMPRLTDANM